MTVLFYNGHKETRCPLIGHRSVKLGRIPGTMWSPWPFLQLLRPPLGFTMDIWKFPMHYIGNMRVKLSLIQGTRIRQSSWAFYWLWQRPFYGNRKAPHALYGAYGCQTRPYIRCKTATMESVLTTIIGLIMGIIKTPGPYFGHRTVKLGLISDTRQPSWTLHQLWWPSPTLYSGLWKSFGPLYRA